MDLWSKIALKKLFLTKVIYLVIYGSLSYMILLSVYGMMMDGLDVTKNSFIFKISLIPLVAMALDFILRTLCGDEYTDIDSKPESADNMTERQKKFINNQNSGNLGDGRQHGGSAEQ